jgi:type IV pilus assembly protein PilF
LSRRAAGPWWVAGALLLALAGCTSTVVTTGPDGRQVVRPEAEPARPERRAQVRLELASLYFGRQQYETALQEVRLALAAQPGLAPAWGLQGLIQSALGDVAAADQSFRRALQLTPRDGELLHNHGWFLCQQQRWDDADARFEQALAQPQYRETLRTLLARGVCQARAGRLEQADRHLSRAYELDPSSPVVAFNLADVLLRRGDFERARFYVGRINAVPELVTAQSLWLAARVEHFGGRPDAARSLGLRLRARFPQSPEALRFERGNFNE